MFCALPMATNDNKASDNFTIKDSGARAELGGGVRDTEENKLDYTLVFDGVMLERYAAHLTKGARKYAARNWLKFFATRESARAAYDRAGRSLQRHNVDYMNGVTDEDHAAAMIFNLNVRETALRKYPDLLEDKPKSLADALRALAPIECNKTSPPIQPGLCPRVWEFDGIRYQEVRFGSPRRHDYYVLDGKLRKSPICFPEEEAWYRNIVIPLVNA